MYNPPTTMQQLIEHVRRSFPVSVIIPIPCDFAVEQDVPINIDGALTTVNKQTGIITTEELGMPSEFYPEQL